MSNKNTKILFMGTPEIAKGCLEQLVNDGYNIVGAFTREDKPVGRKQVLTPPPVKVYAEEKNIPVYQPKKLREEEIKLIKEINPDLIVVVAYGVILPKNIIDIPKYGCINLHVSLLPKYRGAAPIQWAIINGETQTGVTVMYIDEGLDTGDIIDVLPIDIEENETQQEVFKKVENIGKVFLSKTCENILNGTSTRTPQQHSLATLAPSLTKEMAKFTFETSARIIHNKVRGQNPWPGAYFVYNDKKIKVIKTECVKGNGKPGEILSIKPLVVACGEDALKLLLVQPEGSKEMDGQAWCLGRRFLKGDIIN